MEGLFGFIDLRDMETRTCQFPYDAAQTEQLIQHLRDIDPPIDEEVVPNIPIASIAPEDRLLAYHFLLRSIWFMLSRDEPLIVETLPYLMAFSSLAKMRFACIECEPTDNGITVRVSNLRFHDIQPARDFFDAIDLMPPDEQYH